MWKKKKKISKKKHADYCVYSEYSVLKPNIWPSIPIFQKLFFSKKNHADYCDYFEYSVLKPNIRPSIPIIQKFIFFLENIFQLFGILGF